MLLYVKNIAPRSITLALWITLVPALCQAGLHAQAISTTSNALDRINFGDTGTDAYSESAHGFVNLGQPTGRGSLNLTYREIAPSSTPSDVGVEADNEMLTFTMACSSTLQNYLTIQVWGSDTILDFIYLYNTTQGFVSDNYYGTNNPEIDFQTTTDPLLAGRWVYETVPIPLSMTSGNTSVTLTLNAVPAAGGELGSGQTSRPIYSAFTHTNPYLIIAASDPQGTAPSTSAPSPATYNSAYFSSIVSSIANYVSEASNNQIYGPNWTAAMNAGTVPPQIVGSFENGLSPSNNFTTAQWLNNDATYTGGTNSGNNVRMQRLEMLAYAYVTPNFLASFYQNSTTEQQIVAALDSYSYMQALNGCWGDMAAWDGLVTSGASFTSQGRQNAQCSPIEGNGTWALGAAILQMQSDSSFRAALNQDINNTLEPGVLRYQAYQTMLVNNVNFLTGAIGHGHAPNQDELQARSYVYSNLALRALDTIYGTGLAQSNATMYSNYLYETAGLAPAPSGDLWYSNGGLGLEVNGSYNGNFDGGGYGWLDAHYLEWLAKILNDNGIETSVSHPVRSAAINAVHAFSNFIYPSLVASGSGYATTLRNEDYLTFRHNGDVGSIDALSFYYSAAEPEFSDPYAIHGFYLEHANGILQPQDLASPWNDMPAFDSGNADNTAIEAMLLYPDYVTLCNMVNSNPNDTTGVTFLNETAHGNGVWADPTSSTIAIQNNGERVLMTLDWRNTQTPGQTITQSSSEPMDSVLRVHDTTATMDREATVKMPSSAATGASGNYTSGAWGTLYIGRYGNYLVGLNWKTSAATMTLPPDMATTGGTGTDLVSGTSYNLSTTTTVSVPAGGAVALYQSLPTSTLSATSLTFPSTPIYSSATPQTISLTNSGTGPLLISSTSVSGADSSDFSYTTTCGTTVAVNSSCTFIVTFTPQATGTRTATLSIKTCLSTTAQTVTLTGIGLGTASPTTTTVSATPSTLTYGVTTTISASVSGAGPTPTGSVTFYDGTTNLGSANLSSGIAMLAPLTLLAGSHPITAVYAGVAPYGSSTSAVFSVTINKATLSVTANNAARPYGASNPTFTGSVTGAVNGDTFTESFNTTALITSAPMTYSIVPSVSGTDIADYAVTTTSGTLTISQATTSAVVSSSALNSVTGLTVTFTATVSPSTSGTPTGSVSFYDGTTVLGPGTLVSPAIWSLSTSSLAVGSHNITAQYSGDTNFTTSTSAAITEIIVTPQLMLATAPSSVSLAAGGSAGVVLTLTPLYGFTGTVSLSCVGPQTFITCSLPSNVSVGPSATNVNVSISVASTLARNEQPQSPQSTFIQQAGMTVLSCSLLLLYRRRIRAKELDALLALTTLLFTVAISGCGGGKSSSTNAPALPPAGSYTVTLSGANSSLPQPSTTTITVIVTN